MIVRTENESSAYDFGPCLPVRFSTPQDTGPPPAFSVVLPRVIIEKYIPAAAAIAAIDRPIMAVRPYGGPVARFALRIADSIHVMKRGMAENDYDREVEDLRNLAGEK